MKMSKYYLTFDRMSLILCLLYRKGAENTNFQHLFVNYQVLFFPKLSFKSGHCDALHKALLGKEKQ